MNSTPYVDYELTLAVLSVSGVVRQAEAGVAAELIGAHGVLVAVVDLLLTLVYVDTDPQLFRRRVRGARAVVVREAVGGE